MLSSIPISFLVSCLLGFLAGLGVGGGSLLMLWLTLVLQMEYAQARMLNLLFFLPCALSATIFRWKQGSVPYKKIWPAMLAGCAAAAICAWLSSQIDTTLLKKGFGILLLITGIRELLYKPNQNSDKK